ncbi:hypothetical protein [Rhodothermus marinus]|uniref:Uncharacterized protein n=1 Tax=Rhodothermus marinus (strain ATCC 43812 / DSM 4252 / R-10) TaxID=518766 RepID=D0MI05_RHOM4|nr:hypothetical protein [Rhodothermus marinus]ACY48113.1 hypothetical protein Rmar_1223 [Rhodothermus marinus DSM 4252]
MRWPLTIWLMLMPGLLAAQPVYFFGRMGLGQVIEMGTEGIWRPTIGLGLGLETPWPVSIETAVEGFALNWRSPGEAALSRTHLLSDVAFPPYTGRLRHVLFNLALRARLLRYRQGELALGIGPALRYSREKITRDYVWCVNPYVDMYTCFEREVSRQRWEVASYFFIEAGLYSVRRRWGLAVFLESVNASDPFLALGLRITRR